MRVLKDIDFIKWNNRLESSRYRIDSTRWVTNLNNGPSQALSIIQNIETRGGSNTFQSIRVGDPFIRYKFAFSVLESKKDEFFKIHNRLFNGKIANQVCKLDIDKSNSLNLPDVEDIKLTRDVITDLEEIEHMIDDNKYIKYSYNFGGKLTSIISYITILEDTIEFFQKIWGYDTDGKEHNLLKFPIGNIVSFTNDKSTDFMVMDYTYNLDYDKYKIGYIVCEMDTIPNSLIIKYGEQRSVNESELTWSRNSRIDNLLN